MRDEPLGLRVGKGFPRRLALSLFAASGACDLLCEIAWTRALGLVFGVAAFAVSAVLAVFMLGMAAGGFAAERILRRAPDPAVAFVRLHVALGIATVATLPLLAIVRWLCLAATSALPAWTEEPLLVLLSLLVLAAPTALMGMTLPAACALVGDLEVEAFYAAGTLGGVLGAVGAAFVVLPAAGTRGTLVTAALVDAVVALVAHVAASNKRHAARA